MKLGYLKRVLISIDQLANVVLFNGWPDETLSARAWREQWKIRFLIDQAFFWEKDHCRQSYLWEQARDDMPKDY